MMVSVEVCVYRVKWASNNLVCNVVHDEEDKAIAFHLTKPTKRPDRSRVLEGYETLVENGKNQTG
jgi:hypothetical protein